LSPKYISTHRKDFTPADVSYVCDIYGLDLAEVASELNSFRPVYLECCDDVDLTDLASSSVQSKSVKNYQSENIAAVAAASKSTSTTTATTAADENPEIVVSSTDDDNVCDSETESGDEDHGDESRGISSFLVPLRVLCCMSAYPNLLVLYKILSSLPISNCSAERSMSRLKLIKTRLRSTMSDEFLNSLMLLSAEKDILDCLDVDIVINRFAETSSQLKRYLLPS